MDKKYITTSYKQTQKLGEKLAKEILACEKRNYENAHANKEAVVLALRGNLGGGKTTFLQGFAKGLGIKEKILSPTFVIMKKFKVLKPTVLQNRRPSESQGCCFYHIDCYRLKNHKDILEVDFKKIISDPKNIVAIEWPERIKKVLPKNIIFITFKFLDKQTREIKFNKIDTMFC